MHVRGQRESAVDDVLVLLGVFFGASPLATIATVFIFDIPRDLTALISLGLSRLSGASGSTEQLPSTDEESDVTVIIASLDDVEGVLVSLASLRVQEVKPDRVIVFSDGSHDTSVAVLSELKRRGDIDMVLINDLRMGRAVAGNQALRYVQSRFVLYMDCDTRLDPSAIKALRQRLMDRPECAVCSGNIAISNHRASIWTGLQQLEYMIAIDFGREFADTLGAIACCSGAMSMYCTKRFREIGGFSSGSGEDLSATLRLRRAGYEAHFEAHAWAYTKAPETLSQLVSQRLRWDRDAFRIQLVQFRQAFKQSADESLSNTLQRYDYLLFTFLPTMMMPLFVPVLMRIPDAQLPAFIAGGYIFLVLLSTAILSPVFLSYRGRVSGYQILLLPIFPLYQGIVMKGVRLFAYLSEAIWHATSHDGFVPARIRKWLVGRN